MANDGQMATEVAHWTHEARVTSLARASFCTRGAWQQGYGHHCAGGSDTNPYG